ncbi:MAG: SDR family NAD(P)-dependent oxidoreductase [Alphaproteobacteria bacterium]|nr:SDR family NAD(P)-dependent oxidoreductase [Alphaproteobacteria bacterium]
MANILITGSARGLGYELVKCFADAGDRVYATTRNPERADKLKAVADSSGGRVTVHKMDVGDTASVKACAAELKDVPIDVLINNAGVWGGLETQTFQNMDYDNWAFEMNVMAMGPFRVVQAFLPNVMAGQGRKIVTMTSQVASHAYDHVIGYSYAAAKAAVNRLMTGLANEMKDDGVTITLMHPGWIRTEMAGPVADLDPPDAAADVHKVIVGITPADHGKWLKWTGDVHPW